MTFKSARCETCQEYIFDESKLIAYRLTSTSVFGENVARDGKRLKLQKEIIDLKGREPWSGIRCVCFDCLSFFGAEAIKRAEAAK